MKTKILKIGMPLLAFMLAIAFAFATENTTAKNESLVTGYIFSDGVCQSTPKDCNNEGAIPCTYSGNQVYRLNFTTFCAEELFHKD